MQNKKILIIIVFLLIIGAGAGAGVLASRLIHRQSAGSAIDDSAAGASGAAKQQAIKETIKRYNTRDEAASKKDPELCRKLGQDYSDSCILNIAIKAKDDKYCSEIDDDKAEAQCRQLFVKRNVLAGSDISKCQQLTDRVMHQACLVEFFSRFGSVVECDNFSGEEKDLCLDIVNNKLAMQKSDSQQCAVIKDAAMRKLCTETVSLTPLDSDRDGISDDMERSYGTDPLKPDAKPSGNGQ